MRLNKKALDPLGSVKPAGSSFQAADKAVEIDFASKLKDDISDR